MKISPWETIEIEDYSKFFKEFGIEKMPRIKELDDNLYFRRGIVFGHRDFDKFWRAKKKSVLTGIMPSGPMHLGHKMVVDQCVYYQNKGIKTRVLVADIEAITTRGISEAEARKLAINEYLVNWIALGLDPKKTEIYAQSNRSIPYYKLASMLSGRTTLAEMRDIYGDITPGKITSALLQCSDILHPQLKQYDGLHNVLVPIGVDQDPHMRFARDLAEKIGFLKPSSTYHKFMSGLQGEKMSSSIQGSYIGLNESIPTVLKKIDDALTGGRNTAEEQKRLGGQADKCIIYEMYLYHFVPDDKELQEIYLNCTKGRILCGDCKKMMKEKVRVFIEDLAKKREKARNKLNIFGD